MPRKIRELKSALRRAGFVWRPAKGSHTYWYHPDAPHIYLTLPGNDGDDARRYLEQKVDEAIEEVRRFKEQRP